MELNTIYNGESLSVLKTFPSESIDAIVTSPPYSHKNDVDYGLRNYGVEGQLGIEKTPQEYISKLMEIMTECKRVLKKTGSCWVNIGDSYGGTGSKGEHRDPKYKEGRNGQVVSLTTKLSPKSLLGIPERFVITMTDDGWIRRNTIIWHKRNCMPSSVKDRFTIDFEYFYFFVKNKKYYFNTQYEPLSEHTLKQITKKYEGKGIKDYEGNGVQNPSDIKRRILYKFAPFGGKNHKEYGNRTYSGKEYILTGDNLQRIKRAVWTVNVQPIKEKFYAAFPPKLIETPILACSKENDIILDPFLGSGSTVLVAKKLNRRYIGIEINSDYVNIATERINNTFISQKLL